MENTAKSDRQQRRARNTSSHASEPVDAAVSVEAPSPRSTNTQSKTTRAVTATNNARAAYSEEILQPKAMKYQDISEGSLLRHALSRNNTETTTGSTKSSNSLLKDFKDLSRSNTPSEGIVIPAIYGVAKDKRKDTYPSATPSAPRKNPKEYLTELAHINRSASPAEAKFSAALAVKVRDKQQQRIENKTARKTDATSAQTDAEKAAVGRQRHEGSGVADTPIWRGHARAADYQQAILGVPEKVDPRYSVMPESVSTRRSKSTRRSGSTSGQKVSSSSFRGSDDTSYLLPSLSLDLDERPRSSTSDYTEQDRYGEHHVTPTKYDIASKPRAPPTERKASLGGKFKMMLGEYSEKRDMKKEEKQAKKAEERRALLKGNISGPVDTGGGPFPGRDMLGLIADPEVGGSERNPRTARPERPRRPSRVSPAHGEYVTSPSEPREDYFMPKSKHQTNNTTFSQFVSPPPTSEKPPAVPPIPVSKSEKSRGKQPAPAPKRKPDLTAALGHTFEDVAGTLRNYKPHLPHLRKANSDESFKCIGAGYNADGTLHVPQLPPESRVMLRERDTVADTIAAYARPGFEHLPGPSRPYRKAGEQGRLEAGATKGRNGKRDSSIDIAAAQGIAMMPEFDGRARQGTSGVGSRRDVGSKRDTVADFAALAGMPTMPDFERNLSDRTPDGELRDAGYPAPPRPAPTKTAPRRPRDTAYISIYSREDSPPREGSRERTSPVSPLSARDSWENDDESYVPPRQGWNQTSRSGNPGREDERCHDRRVSQNSYYRMVERDRRRDG